MLTDVARTFDTKVPSIKNSGGSLALLKQRSQSSPSGCTRSNAITGVMLTLGYLSEKNRLVADPKTAKSRDRNHMRGVLIDKETLSVAGTEART